MAAFAVLFTLGALVVAGVVGWLVWLGAALAAVGLIMAATAATGYCPIERVTGIESKGSDRQRSDSVHVGDG